MREIQRSLRLLDLMHPQLTTLTRAVNLLNTNGFSEAIRQMQRQQAEVNRTLALTDHAVRRTDLFKATLRLHELNLQVSDALKGTGALSDDFNRIHHSWISDLGDVMRSSTQLSSVTQLALSDISYRTAATKALFDGIDLESLRKHLNVRQPFMSDVQLSLSKFTASYNLLVESFRSLDSLFERPQFVLLGATRELSNTGFALDALRPQSEQQETEDFSLEIPPEAGDDFEYPDFVALLEGVGPEFVAMYDGAVAALEGNNPERSRHVLASLRELWNHLLRKLAPSEELGEWIGEQDNPRLLHDGSPTRYAKIRYVLRELIDEPLIEFVEADTTAMVKLYDLYGRLHRLETGVTDDQLRVIVLKTQSYLDYILRAWEWSRE